MFEITKLFLPILTSPSWGQVHQLLLHQIRAAFALIIFDTFMATAFGNTALKYGARHKSCILKYAAKFQGKCILSRTPYFCINYSMISPLHIAQIGW
jgi:hypothetical protein